MNTTAAVAVREASAAAEARRIATLEAERANLGEAAVGRVALVVTELATNLARHAHEGEILIRRLDNPAERVGLEIIAIDKGPGMPDVALARQDGHSTGGTLGHGLGAIERQSDEFHVYSHPTGTAMLARIYRPLARQTPDPSPLDVGGIVVSKPGETVCGDAWAWRLRRDRLAVVLVDGLGHGLQAADAAREAVLAFERSHEQSPPGVLSDIHDALRSTRGAAVAVLAIDLERGVAQYAGAGNTAAVIIHPSGARQSMVSMNGTAGHVLARIQEFSYPVPSGSLVLLHTDGVSTSWDLAAYPGLRRRHPSLVGAVLYRDHARRRDDAGVVVIQQGNRTFDPHSR